MDRTNKSENGTQMSLLVEVNKIVHKKKQEERKEKDKRKE